MDEESDGMDEMREDPIEKRKSYERYFREHLYIDDLKQSYPYDHGRIDEILDLLVDTVCSTAKTIRCAGEDRPAEVVKSRFMKLDYGHIQYVLDCIHDNTTEVRNIKAYMLTTLGHIKDYRCIMDYGPRALEIEPGILTAYYWIIIAADETGNSTAREKFLQKAAEDLIDEENEKLKKLLALQNHMS